MSTSAPEVSASTVRVALTPRLSSDALRRATPAQQLVLSMPHLDGPGLASALGVDVTCQKLARLRDRGLLLGIRCGRHGYLYPSFQVDARKGQFVPVVARINGPLSRRLGVEGALRWWADTSDQQGVSRLDRLHDSAGLIAEATTS